MQIYIDFNVGMISHGKVCTLTTDVCFIFRVTQMVTFVLWKLERRDNISYTNKNKSFSEALYDQVTAATEQLQPQKLSDILCSRFINDDQMMVLSWPGKY